MEKVLDFWRNRNNSCGLACRAGMRVTGWQRMAVCPQEELVSGRGGKGLGTVEDLKEPGWVGSWEH